ncbi:CatB-related O-acetyltransferase [Desulfitobacterium hafniense]|uniref:CatB-related O-acetyltransferase n=1 Tax=Desulfitobacterium hafniense TaxID=49338 RepID=UPI0003672792|nr:CatB-related O-acetyltransferase [Desulfitobacterium hafniense]
MEHNQIIASAIEKQLTLGHHDFAIYPFGKQGVLTKNILNDHFGIKEHLIIDNRLCKSRPSIKDVHYLSSIDCSKLFFLLTCDNSNYYKEIRSSLEQYVAKENIVDIFPKTTIGKYSFGPLARHHILIESVGAFCSFAPGTAAVLNHIMSGVSTHMIFHNGLYENYCNRTQQEFLDLGFFMPGIDYTKGTKPMPKSKIGNDVWLGRNVIITNASNIGNGVIAGAGAVITKDVPDYAVVAGVPARIVKYRYDSEQIQKLNEIAWWDWSDAKILACYEDFFDIDVFLSKHYPQG